MTKDIRERHYRMKLDFHLKGSDLEKYPGKRIDTNCFRVGKDVDRGCFKVIKNNGKVHH